LDAEGKRVITGGAIFYRDDGPRETLAGASNGGYLRKLMEKKVVI
jgi:hypothetical protein